MLRYHGVLAAHHKLRSEVVASLQPPIDPSPPPPAQLPLFEEELPPRTSGRHPWAWLLRRVFSAEVSVCAECGGKMRIVEIATDAADATRVLYELGLGPRPPPRPSSALPGQLPLRFEK